MSVRIINADVRDGMRQLRDEGVCVQTCVTSPPYFGLRDYGHAGQIGLESTPEEYIAKLVEVFRGVRDVLADDGTLWLNIGDSYAANRSYQVPSTLMNGDATNKAQANDGHGMRASDFGVKPKDLIGIPWMLAFALRADGWYLRQDIIWHKPNPMPESVRDRCTKSHEYIFLLSKSERYYFDADAIAEDAKALHIGEMDGGSQRLPDGSNANEGRNYVAGKSGNKERKPATGRGAPRDGVAGSVPWEGFKRNKRSVWTVTTKPFAGAHFAVFPPDLVEPCVLAGSRAGDIVLDPFGGSGTTGLVADRFGRNGVLIEINPTYADMARRRIHADAPLFSEIV